jgi:N-dimethylarginine dimethylaminohydrolase/nucleoside-diphosphate-sugar epimerase/uncharacterized protein YbdZ (MbtH family)
MWQAWEKVYRLDQVTTHLQVASLGFDVFTGDLLRSLLSGAALVICPAEITLDPAALYELLRSEQVELAEFTPATFRPLMRWAASAGVTLGFMRVIVVGSDRWTAAEYKAACEIAGGAEVVNSFGATEAAIDSTALFGPDWVPAGDGTVPIGRPLPGVEAYVVSEDLEFVPDGAVGELAIGGVGVSYGYPGDPSMTASRFRPDPFSGRPGARLYLTGDLAWQDPDGLLTLAGRADDQVKIRGVRIEPGEVEVAMAGHPDVREAAVVARPGQAGEPVLIGYVTPATADPVAVRGHAALHLHPAMVPVIVAVESLPLTANGKVDRGALGRRPLPPRRPPGPHRDPVTRRVAEIWCELLGESAVHADDDWYLIGGDSLRGAQGAARLQAAFGIPVPLWVTEEHRTLGELAGWMRAQLQRRPGVPRRHASDPAAAAASADVLVTGGTGGVGAFIVQVLARSGLRVAVAGREESAAAAYAACAASFIHADLADTGRLTELARHARAIVHAACTFADPETDVGAMTALLAGWRAGPGGPFTFLSTTDVYGLDPGPYAAGKAACEQALAAAAGDRPWTVLRPGYIWGPHERLARQLRWADLRWLVELLTEGAAVHIPGPAAASARQYGDGWIHALDLAAAVAASLKRPARQAVDAVAGHFSWRGLARTLAAELGSASPVLLRAPAGDPHATRYRCDPGQLPALLGVTPEHRRYRPALREVIADAPAGMLATRPAPGLPATAAGQAGSGARWQAVVNDVGQYSVWPAGPPLPAGWRPGGADGTRAQCLAKITEIWPDSLPAAVRHAASGTARAPRRAPRPDRTAHARTYLMCPPAFFTVKDRLNARMDPRDPPDPALAWQQWRHLKAVLEDLGHTVHTIDPVPGLTGMVFAADGATVIDGKVLASRYLLRQRAPESAAYQDWLIRDGYGPAAPPRAVAEGGDILYDGRAILAGHGFRTDQAAAAEIEAVFGLPVLSLRLTSQYYYHLDTALSILDDETAAYYPAAFDVASRAALAGHFPVLEEATDEDAGALGLNGISDGRHVVMAAKAIRLATRIAALGFTPVPVDVSELLKSGGGPKCCVLELRPPPEGAGTPMTSQGRLPAGRRAAEDARAWLPQVPAHPPCRPRRRQVVSS